MNELITQKESHLREENILLMHKECREWLSDIEFWNIEVRFFYHLISSKYVKSVLEGKEELFNTAKSRLNSYKENILLQLKKDILEQEKLLYQIAQNETQNELEYKEKQNELSERMTAFKNEYKEIKKDFFIVMENWP